MRQTRTRRAATALLMACVFGGGLAPPLSAHDAHNELESATPTVATTANTMGCPSQISCGSGCVAQLGAGFCVTLVDTTTKNTFFPKLSLTCKVCDCMYIAPGPNGSVLLRKVDLGCEGGFEGLVLY